MQSTKAHKRGSAAIAVIALLISGISLLSISAARATLPEGMRADWFEESKRAVQVIPYSDRDQLLPGEEFTLALQYIPFHNDEFAFHIYDNNMPADYSYVPTVLAMDPADGVVWAEPVFPPGEQHDTQMWLTGQPVVLIKGTLAEDAAPGPRTFTAKTMFTACTEDFCLTTSEVAVEWKLTVLAAGSPAPEVRLPADLMAELPYSEADYSLREDFEIPEENAAALFADADEAADEESSAAGSTEGGNYKMAPASEGSGAFSLEDVQQQIKENELPLWKVLFFALLGGLILNFMPCVLPVVSIKVISLVKDIDKDPRHMVNHGIVFALGILVTFLIGAVVIAIIQAAGTQLGWGNQFQSPTFVLVMTTIIFLFGLSLAGVFTIKPPSAITDAGEKLSEKEGYSGSFFKGVLATVLGTPCVGPFLGPALTYAFTRQWYDTLLIFMMVGVGMAVPYLAMLPMITRMGRRERGQLARKLLDSKTWLVDFERVMAFLMFGTVIYLLFILQGVYGGNAIALIWALVYLTGVAFAAWIWGRVSTIGGRTMFLGGTLALALIAFFAWFSFDRVEIAMASHGAIGAASTSAHGNWEPFSREALQQHIAEGRTVLVDFTADWCPNCKTNEAVALNIPETQELASELGVVMMMADWTQRDQEIGDTLRTLGYSSIPLTAIFPAKSPERPILLDGLFSAAIIQEKLREASAGVVAQSEHEVEVEPASSEGARPGDVARPDLFGESRYAVLLQPYSDRRQVAPGEEFTLALQYMPYHNERFKFHIYGAEANPAGGYLPTSLTMAESEFVSFEAAVFPPGEQHKDQLWLSGQPVALVKARLSSDAKPGPMKIDAKTVFMSCTDEICLLPSEVEVSWEIEVVAAPDSAQEVLAEAELKKALPYDPLEYRIPEENIGLGS